MKKAYFLVGVCLVLVLIAGLSCDRQKMMDNLMRDPAAVDQLVKSIVENPEAADRMINSVCADSSAAEKVMDKIVGDSMLTHKMMTKFFGSAPATQHMMTMIGEDPAKMDQIKAMLKGKKK